MNEIILNNLYKDFSSSDYSEKSSFIRFSQSLILSIALNNKQDYELNVLDYGCGPGNMVKWMNNNGYHFLSYCGFDLRVKTINEAKNKNNCDWASFSCSLEKKKYDCCFLLGTFSYAYDFESQCKTDFKNIIEEISFISDSIILTLPRNDYESIKTRNKMVRYSLDEINQLMKEISSFYLIDKHSLSNEYILGFKPKLRSLNEFGN